MFKDAIRKLLNKEDLTDFEKKEVLQWFEQAETVPPKLIELMGGEQTVTALSQMTGGILGDITRGNFLSGNSGDPEDPTNNPYTGVGMVAPGLTVGSDTAAIFGQNAGAMSFWLSALTGAVLAGGGSVKLDNNGITIVGGTAYSAETAIKFMQGANLSADIYEYTSGGASYFVIEKQALSGNANSLSIVTTAASGQNSGIDIAAIGNAGTPKIKLYQAGGGILLNPDSGDVDSIVKGTSDANLLFADAGTDRVGIGTGTPGYKLDVRGDVGLSGKVYVGRVRTAYYLMNDDTAVSFTPTSVDGPFIVNTGTANCYGMGWGQVGAGGGIVGHVLGSATVVGTGALTTGAGDGTDTKLNLNVHTDGKWYLKNRTGGTIGLYVTLL